MIEFRKLQFSQSPTLTFRAFYGPFFICTYYYSFYGWKNRFTVVQRKFKMFKCFIALCTSKRSKGQLISKCLFGVFNFSQKNEQKQAHLRYHSRKIEFFVHFSGELRIPESPFEINWPLWEVWPKYRIRPNTLNYFPYLLTFNLLASSNPYEVPTELIFGHCAL